MTAMLNVKENRIIMGLRPNEHNQMEVGSDVEAFRVVMHAGGASV